MDSRPLLEHEGSDDSSVPGSEAASCTVVPVTQRPQDAEISHRPEQGPTFIQQQLSFQRSPSSAKEQASVLSRTVSVKSNKSGDIPENQGRDSERSNASSLSETSANQCALSKSLSERSAKSVKSMHAVGSHPWGTLRVHSPSPQRVASNDNRNELLRSGDVIIMSNIPAGSLLGVDTKAFEVKKEEDFGGIREMPSGSHFVWGGSSQGSLRNGFWLMSQRRASDECGEIHVLHWDSYCEILVE